MTLIASFGGGISLVVHRWDCNCLGAYKSAAASATQGRFGVSPEIYNSRERSNQTAGLWICVYFHVYMSKEA